MKYKIEIDWGFKSPMELWVVGTLGYKYFKSPISIDFLVGGVFSSLDSQVRMLTNIVKIRIKG